MWDQRARLRIATSLVAGILTTLALAYLGFHGQKHIIGQVKTAVIHRGIATDPLTGVHWAWYENHYKLHDDFPLIASAPPLSPSFFGDLSIDQSGPRPFAGFFELSRSLQGPYDAMRTIRTGYPLRCLRCTVHFSYYNLPVQDHVIEGIELISPSERRAAGGVAGLLPTTVSWRALFGDWAIYSVLWWCALQIDLVFVMMRSRQRVRNGLCKSCGYGPLAMVGICPECGEGSSPRCS
jgi:hypothetical protein